MTPFFDPIFRSASIEKCLLAPSLRVGHQWMEAAVRGGDRVINLRTVTPTVWALELAAPLLAERGLSLAPARFTALAVEASWKSLPRDGYLAQLKPSPAVYAATASSLEAVWLAGIEGSGLSENCFEVPAKAADLKVLSQAAQKLLAEHHLVDRAGAFRLAIEWLRQNPPSEHQLLIVPEGYRPSGLERVLIDAVPADRKRVVRFGASLDDGRDLQLLRFLRDPAAAPAPKQDGSVTFFRAIGEANEVREVLRRCLAEGRPFDEVELVCADAETYIPLIYAVGVSLADAKSFSKGLPLTFAEGIPASTSRPARALTGWLRWIAEDFSQPLLVRLLMEDVFRIAAAEGSDPSAKPVAVYLATLLRPLAVGLGGTRYLPRLDDQIAAEAKHVTAAENSDSDDAAAMAAAKRHRSRLNGLKAIRKLVADLLERGTSIVSGSPSEILKAAEAFVTEVALANNELDRNCRLALVEEIRQMRTWIEKLGVAGDARSWLLSLAAEMRLLGSGPRPGHLHVASLNAGGHSGRPRTFVVGLSDDRFPGAGLADPILLDGERERLHAELPTARARLSARVEDFAEQLARLPGTVTLSWPCRDLHDDRELLPSPAVMTAFRIVSGRGDADLAALDEHTGLPASFAPSDPKSALSESELWLATILSGSNSTKQQLARVARRHPHLAHGLEAERRRQTGEFCEYNGCVPEAGRFLDPFAADSRPLSASGIELAGKCPRAFFFRRALGLEPLEEEDVDHSCWLDPLTSGGLLHEVFRASLSEIVEAGETPEFARHHRRLMAILHAAIEQCRQELPPPNEHVYQADVRRLTDIAEAFLYAEEQAATKSQPRYFEVSLGLLSEGSGTPLDDPEPVTITLPSGRSIRLRGRIDRIDSDPAEPHGYCIWDYKTGSSTTRFQKKLFNDGRVLQNALYVPLAEAALRAKIDPAARVTRFGYLFPAIDGRIVEWPADALSAGQKLVDFVCDLIAAGGFLATNDTNDCMWCDYQSACGKVDDVACQSEQVLANVDGGPLTSFVQLRR